VSDLDLTEAIEAARRVLGWGDTSAEMDRAIPKLAEIIARHVDRQVRDRIAADIEAMLDDPGQDLGYSWITATETAVRIARGEVQP
jgi:hypothetical protein